MTPEEAFEESLQLSIRQLRKASNLIRMGDDEDLQEASDLVLAASNVIVRALWQRGKGQE
jgi:hypothetical protein